MRYTTLRTRDREAEAIGLRTGTRLATAADIHAATTKVSRMSVTLWVVQGLLAALFLFAGGMKVVAPIAMLTKQVPLPGLFLRFIGLAEFAGALGLILPGLLRIRPQLTPLAAGGLVIIMSGATGITMATGQMAPALMPLVVGLLAGFVAFGRTHLEPTRGTARWSFVRKARAAARRTVSSPVLQPAR